MSAETTDAPVTEVCCEVGPGQLPGSPAICPSCGSKGRKVAEITLRSLLAFALRQDIRPVQHYFCAEADCPVVYFPSDGGRVYQEDDLIVPVWQKSKDPAVPVCYCFGYSEDAIRQESEPTRKTDVYDRIKAEVAAGRCACEVTNPQGSCCLGNVLRVVSRVREIRRGGPSEARSSRSFPQREGQEGREGQAPPLRSDAIKSGQEFVGSSPIIEGAAHVGISEDALAVDDEGSGKVDPLLMNHKLLGYTVLGAGPGQWVGQDGEGEVQLPPPPGGAKDLLCVNDEDLRVSAAEIIGP